MVSVSMSGAELWRVRAARRCRATRRLRDGSAGIRPRLTRGRRYNKDRTWYLKSSATDTRSGHEPAISLLHPFVDERTNSALVASSSALTNPMLDATVAAPQRADRDRHRGARDRGAEDAHRRQLPARLPADVRVLRAASSCPAWASPGHIARKIAATLASTGTPAFFVHPGEASHGDLGMITHKDVVLALSNSGETDELLTILPVIKRQGIPLIVMTGNPGLVAGDDGRRASGCQRARRSLPAGPRADREHDRGAGHGRCAGDRAARSARIHR